MHSKHRVEGTTREAADLVLPANPTPTFCLGGCRCPLHLKGRPGLQFTEQQMLTAPLKAHTTVCAGGEGHPPGGTVRGHPQIAHGPVRSLPGNDDRSQRGGGHGIGLTPREGDDSSAMPGGPAPEGTVACPSLGNTLAHLHRCGMCLASHICLPCRHTGKSLTDSVFAHARPALR